MNCVWILRIENEDNDQDTTIVFRSLDAAMKCMIDDVDTWKSTFDDGQIEWRDGDMSREAWSKVDAEEPVWLQSWNINEHEVEG